MATLTEVSAIARKSIKYGAIGLVIIMLIPVVWRMGLNIYRLLNPPPPAPPTVRYGKLPKLDFPPVSDEAIPTYKLETIEGGLPKLATTSRVYIVGINKSRLLTIDRIKKKIVPEGFLPDPQELDEKTFRFYNPNTSAQVIYNIISEGFAYNYDWTGEKQLYLLHSMPIGNQAITEARTFFNTFGALPTDISSGTGKFIYLVATGSAMIPTDYTYQANLVRVDLFREDMDKMRIVTAGVDTSPISAVISGLTGSKRVVQANYQYSKVLDNDYATYPLKGIDVAWEELKKGKGYIAKRTTENVTVRKAYLAYYESSDPQEFLQPVYVFEGDQGFTAYIPAVRDDYTQ